MATKYKYVRMAVKQPDGKYKYKKVAVSQKRAQRIRQKATAAKPKRPKHAKMPKSAPIPKPYRGLVDTREVDDAVRSVIHSENAPLRSAQQEIRANRASNIRAANSIDAQAQEAMRGFMANAASGTGNALQIAAQQAAADERGLDQSADFLRRTFGGAMNEHVRQGLAPAYGALSTQANSTNVGETYGLALGGNLQRDFLQRAAAVATLTKQAFTQEQREQASKAVQGIAREIAANRGKAAALRRQFMQEDAQFGLERRTAEQAFGLQKDQLQAQIAEAKAAGDQAQLEMLLEAQEQQNKDAYKQERDRIKDAQWQANYDLQAAKAKAAAAGRVITDKRKAQEAMAKRRETIFTQLERMRQQVGKPHHKDKNGVQQVYSTRDVFGPNNGPWREAFKRLTATGYTPNQAARIATQWYPESIRRAGTNKTRIRKMLQERGVKGAVLQSIVRMAPNPPAHGQAGSIGPQAPKGVLQFNAARQKYEGKKFARPGIPLLGSPGGYVRVNSLQKSGNQWVWMVTNAGKKETHLTKPGRKPAIMGGGTA